MKIITLLLIPMLSFSQLSVKVDSLYRVIYATDQVQNNFIGIGGDGMVDGDYESLYSILDSLATDDELLYIAAKGNKTIKYHMNEILVDRKSNHLAKMFKQYLFNDQEINISGGCMAWPSSFAAALYIQVSSQKTKIESIRYNKEHYTPEELTEYDYLDTETKWSKSEVDSLLTILNESALSNDNVLPITLQRIFRCNDFKFDNYKRIRYFAYKYPKAEILATLASFQNKKDLPLFHKNIDNASLAILKFPDKSFIPDLKVRFEKYGFDRYFLNAATAFCSKDAEELLQLVIDKFEKRRNEISFIDGETLGSFYNYLEEKNCASNDEFLVKMWTEHRIISYSFFIKIKDNHYNEILKGYQNTLPFSSAPIREDFVWGNDKKEYDEADGYLCPIILRYLKSNPASKKVDLDAISCTGF